MKMNSLQLHTATRRKLPKITSNKGATYQKKKKKKTYRAIFRIKKANTEWQYNFVLGVFLMVVCESQGGLWNSSKVRKVFS